MTSVSSGQTTSWNQLLRFASSPDSIHRVGAVATATGKLENALKALGYYSLLLDNGTRPTLFPLVRAICVSMKYPARNGIEQAILTRNRFIHEMDVPAAQCVNAVQEVRSFLKAIALGIDRIAEDNADEQNPTPPRVG
jgi:hypothetical protein